MSENTALVPVGQMSITEVMTVGQTMAKSGFFTDATDAAKAVVKILAGREMGFGPFASMTDIHIIQGKPSIGANLMASAVKANPRYDYRVVYLEKDGCELAFFERGQELGRSAFTKDDADAAGLAGKATWRAYPRNMYFARALSNGVRWYCPDVFNGNTVYTPEELGAVVDGETGAVIELEPTITTTSTTPSNGGDKQSSGVLPAEEWANIPPPKDYTDLWTRNLHLLIGFDNKPHAINAVVGKNTGVYPGKKLGDDVPVEDAWAAMLDHQRSKMAEQQAEEADGES